MKFTKMHGCGNDYIYVNCFEEEVPDPAAVAVRLSNRHFGIGGDGLILIEPSDKADAFMHMFNADGSEGMMCGNGIRCVAKYIYDNGLIPADRDKAYVETPAGIREIGLDIQDGKVTGAAVDMGTAEIGGAPEKLVIDGMSLVFTSVSTGNPHAVFFLEDNPDLRDIDSLPLEKLGPAIEDSGRFPDGVNAEFIEILSLDEINFRVWERGSGETYACGTGATAAAFAGHFAGKLAGKVLVHLKGGDLEIECGRDTGRCIMTGPAVTVFTGEIEI